MKGFVGTILLSFSLAAVAQPGAFALLSPENGEWANATPRFEWGPSTGATSYSLYVDGALFQGNLTASSYHVSDSESLSEQIHTWYVVALDAANNTTQSTQTFSVRVDATPPAQFSLVAPANASWTADVQPNLQWSEAADAGSGLAKYQLWIDGEVNIDSIPTSKTDTVPKNSRLGPGEHSWEIRAVDSVGNYRISAQTWTFRIDNVPPSFADMAVAQPRISVRWDECDIWYRNWNTWEIRDTSGHVVLSGPDNNTYDYTYNRSVSLSVGSYRFFAFDVGTGTGNRDGWSRNGCMSGSSYGYFSIDNAAYGDGSHNNTEKYGTSARFGVGFDGNGVFTPSDRVFIAADTPAFSWHSAMDSGIGFGKYQIYIDDTLIYDNVSDTTLTASEPLSYGQHEWTVRACDELGNYAPVFPMQFQIDNRPPVAFGLVTPLDSAVVDLPTPSLSWEASGDSSGGSGLARYELWLNGSVDIDSIPASTTTTTPKAALAEGWYGWCVKAYDKVGNVRTSSQTRTFVVDYGLPGPFTLESPADDDTVRTPRPRFVWRTSTDAGSGVKAYVVHVTGQAPDTIRTADTATYCPTPLANGAYSWYVVALDRLNNARSSDTCRFIVDSSNFAAPVLTAPSDGSVDLPLTTTLEWETVAGASDYWVQISTDSSFEDSRPAWHMNTVQGASAVAWGNGRFVCVGKEGAIATSVDGLSWTGQSPITANSLYSVAYGSGEFVAVGENETILISSDGIAWTELHSVPNSLYTYKSITYGNGLFAVVGGPYILISSDGGTWREKTSFTGSLNQITAGDGIFLALDNLNSGLHVYSIEPWDRIDHSWSGGTLPKLTCVSYGNGMYAGALVSTIWTSPDAEVWASNDIGATASLSFMTHANGRFMAVSHYRPQQQGQSPTAGPVYTSPDGTAWATTATGSEAVLSHITWGNNRLVAVDGDSTILTSPPEFAIVNKYAAAASVAVEELRTNTTYFWRVCTRSADGANVWSDPWRFSTTTAVAAAPGKPSILAPVCGSVVTADSTTIVWSASDSTADGYCIELSTDSLFTGVVFTDSTLTDSSTTLRNLSDQADYWVRVKAHNTSGWGGWSDICKIVVDTAGTGVVVNRYTFMLNSTSLSGTMIRYSLPKTSDVRLRVFDLHGKLVQALIRREQGAGTYTINIRNALSAGYYLLDFEAGEYSARRMYAIFK